MDPTASKAEPAPLHGSAARPSPAIGVAILGPDLLAATGYGVIVLLFFWRTLSSGAAPAGLDLIDYSYPPDRLFSWIAGAGAWRYSMAVHLLLGALFTYLVGRLSVGLSPLAAWMAGAVFALGGFLGSQAERPNQLHAAVWLPLLLLCLDRAAKRRSLAAVAVSVLAFALQLLAGDLQLVYYSWWTLVLFGLWVATSRSEGDGSPSLWNRTRPLMVLGLLAVTGFILALVPTGHGPVVTQETYRPGGFPFREAVAPSVPVRSLMDSVLPLYFARPDNGLIGYTGVVSLVLLPAALARRWKGSYQWFFLVLGTLALAASLGAETPLYGWLFGVVPGFNLFRAPGRWLFVYSLSVSLLAGMGVESLRGSLSAEAFRRWLGGYGLACAAGVAVVVGIRLWLGSSDHDFELPHPRILLNWWLFAGAAFGLVIAARAWAGAKWVLWLLAGLALLDLYLAKTPLWYDNVGQDQIGSAALTISHLIPAASLLRIVGGVLLGG